MRILFCDDTVEVLNQLQKYVSEFFRSLGGAMPDFAAYTSGDELLARLMTFPNVLVTSHMGFFTKEAMQAIAIETLENAYMLEQGLPLVNEVKADA